MKQIGNLWKNEGPTASLPPLDLPIISSNLALGKGTNSSWSDDMDIMDFANDDNYGSSWKSNPLVSKPWFELELGNETALNTIVVVEQKSNIDSYILEYWNGVEWLKVYEGKNGERIKIHRFGRVWASKVRIRIMAAKETPSIAEFQVLNERR